MNVDSKQCEEVYHWICENSGNYIQRLFNKFKSNGTIIDILKELEKNSLIYLRYEMEMGGDSYEHVYATTFKWFWEVYTKQIEYEISLV